MTKKCLLYAVMLGILLFVCSAHAQARSTLSYNSRGDEVTALQERLAELGYYTFRVTGIYQENTQKAIEEFQEDNGLLVDGIANDALQQMIFSAGAPARPRPTLHPNDKEAPFPGILRGGDENEDVIRIQTRLSGLGFYEKKITGYFGNETKASVRAFQRHNGLIDDGVVGEATWESLFFDEEVVDSRSEPRPSASPAPIPYYIEVDVATQVITVFGVDEQGEYTDKIREMICSTGTGRDPTPLKRYILDGKKARWSYFPKWGTHAQYWTRMDAANAFHSVIYTQPDVMALKTGSYSALGKPASHGCIRLLVEDAKWIYNNCGAGTEVLVFEGEPDPELTQSLKPPKLDRSRMLPVETPEPSPAPIYNAGAIPPLPLAKLAKGDEGESVYWMQSKLAQLGYYKGTITGGYYDGTKEAVAAFQEQNGLRANGIADEKTLSLLYADVLMPGISDAESAKPAAEVSASPEPTVTPAPEKTKAPKEEDAEKPSFDALPITEEYYNQLQSEAGKRE